MRTYAERIAHSRGLFARLRSGLHGLFVRRVRSTGAGQHAGLHGIDYLIGFSAAELCRNQFCAIPSPVGRIKWHALRLQGVAARSKGSLPLPLPSYTQLWLL